MITHACGACSALLAVLAGRAAAMLDEIANVLAAQAGREALRAAQHKPEQARRRALARPIPRRQEVAPGLRPQNAKAPCTAALPAENLQLTVNGELIPRVGSLCRGETGTADVASSKSVPIRTREGAEVRAVAAGTPIGPVGDSGGSAEPGIYFEVRVDGRPVDALRWAAAR